MSDQAGNFIVGLLKKYPSKIFRLAFPLIFWAALLRLLAALNLPPLNKVGNFLFGFWNIYLVIGLVILAGSLIGIVIGSAVVIRTFTAIQRKVPSIASQLLKNPSNQTVMAMKNEVLQTLLNTYIRFFVFSLQLFSRMYGPEKQYRPAKWFGVIIGLLLQYPGSIVINIIAGRTLERAIVVSSISTPVTVIELALGSPLVLGIFIISLTIIDFSIALQEARRSGTRQIMDRFVWLSSFLNEFNVVPKITPLIPPVCIWLVFGSTYKDSVECPDSTTLRRLVEDTLTIQLGPSYVFYYKFEELFPEKHTKALREEMKDYLKRTQPVAFVGIHEGNCVFIAYASKSDVRRVTLWAGSNVLTSNMVTKLKSLITSLRPYEVT